MFDLKSLSELEEFDNHKLVTFVFDKESGLQGFIAIHRGNGKHPSFGATRLWDYNSEESALRDALRLSRTMSYKAAIAGLKYGGAKAALLKNGHINRDKLLKSYAERVNFLSGHFVTGTDVGISDTDVKKMRRRSKFFVGVKTNPARYTGLGVYFALQACLKERFGDETMLDKSIAIQGLGKTGSELLKLVYQESSKIYVTDLNKDTLRNIKKLFPKVIIVSPDKIHFLKADVFSPCALYHTINKANVEELQFKIICGSANNQLESDSLADELYRMKILYAPDFVVNAGGLISVVDEYEYGNFRVKRVVKRVEVIKTNIKKIIRKSKRTGRSTDKIARELAEKTFQSYDK